MAFWGRGLWYAGHFASVGTTLFVGVACELSAILGVWPRCHFVGVVFNILAILWAWHLHKFGGVACKMAATNLVRGLDAILRAWPSPCHPSWGVV